MKYIDFSTLHLIWHPWPTIIIYFLTMNNVPPTPGTHDQPNRPPLTQDHQWPTYGIIAVILGIDGRWLGISSQPTQVTHRNHRNATGCPQESWVDHRNTTGIYVKCTMSSWLPPVYPQSPLGVLQYMCVSSRVWVVWVGHITFLA